jgi:lysophospholipase L1-like esterase
VLRLRRQPFALKSGDRVVFYGDSITDQRLYTTFAESYVVTRFPQLNVTFTHSGWGGDRVGGGGGGPIDTRLDRDVFPYKPTVMTIMLGMNDGGYKALDQGLFDKYKDGMRHIVDTVRQEAARLPHYADPALRIRHVTRTPTFEGGYNSVLIQYSGFLKELATAEKLNLADLNTPVASKC